MANILSGCLRILAQGSVRISVITADAQEFIIFVFYDLSISLLSAIIFYQECQQQTFNDYKNIDNSKKWWHQNRKVLLHDADTLEVNKVNK